MRSHKGFPREGGPYALGSDAERERRLAMLRQPHVAQLTAFVRGVRARRRGDRVPYFDPLDGGTRAEALFLLEAPGPQVVRTGFVSRDNPDPTARNLRGFLIEAGICRRRTALWNVVPWYIGTGERIRPATGADVAAGAAHLDRLLPLFPQLRAVVLVGRKAQSARHIVERLTPSRAFEMLHPGNQVVACFPVRVRETRRVLKALASFLNCGVPATLCEGPNHLN
jgi:uracil-DNA glycosylase